MDTNSKRRAAWRRDEMERRRTERGRQRSQMMLERERAAQTAYMQRYANLQSYKAGGANGGVFGDRDPDGPRTVQGRREAVRYMPEQTVEAISRGLSKPESEALDSQLLTETAQRGLTDAQAAKATAEGKAAVIDAETGRYAAETGRYDAETGRLLGKGKLKNERTRNENDRVFQQGQLDFNNRRLDVENDQFGQSNTLEWSKYMSERDLRDRQQDFYEKNYAPPLPTPIVIPNQIEGAYGEPINRPELYIPGKGWADRPSNRPNPRIEDTGWF